MSGFTFRLRSAPDERIDVSELTPRRLAALSSGEIERIVIGSTKRQVKVGDVFTVGGRAGDSVGPGAGYEGRGNRDAGS